MEDVFLFVLMLLVCFIAFPAAIALVIYIVDLIFPQDDESMDKSGDLRRHSGCNDRS